MLLEILQVLTEMQLTLLHFQCYGSSSFQLSNELNHSAKKDSKSQFESHIEHWSLSS